MSKVGLGEFRDRLTATHFQVIIDPEAGEASGVVTLPEVVNTTWNKFGDLV